MMADRKNIFEGLTDPDEIKEVLSQQRAKLADHELELAGAVEEGASAKSIELLTNDIEDKKRQIEEGEELLSRTATQPESPAEVDPEPELEPALSEPQPEPEPEPESEPVSPDSVASEPELESAPEPTPVPDPVVSVLERELDRDPDPEIGPSPSIVESDSEPASTVGPIVPEPVAPEPEPEPVAPVADREPELPSFLTEPTPVPDPVVPVLERELDRDPDPEIGPSPSIVESDSEPASTVGPIVPEPVAPEPEPEPVAPVADREPELPSFLTEPTPGTDGSGSTEPDPSIGDHHDPVLEPRTVGSVQPLGWGDPDDREGRDDRDPWLRPVPADDASRPLGWGDRGDRDPWSGPVSADDAPRPLGWADPHGLGDQEPGLPRTAAEPITTTTQEVGGHSDPATHQQSELRQGAGLLLNGIKKALGIRPPLQEGETRPSYFKTPRGGIVRAVGLTTAVVVGGGIALAQCDGGDSTPAVNDQAPGAQVDSGCVLNSQTATQQAQEALTSSQGDPVAAVVIAEQMLARYGAPNGKCSDSVVQISQTVARDYIASQTGSPSSSNVPSTTGQATDLEPNGQATTSSQPSVAPSTAAAVVEPDETVFCEDGEIVYDEGELSVQDMPTDLWEGSSCDVAPGSFEDVEIDNNEVVRVLGQ
jgi:hypothetical protein